MNVKILNPGLHDLACFHLLPNKAHKTQWHWKNNDFSFLLILWVGWPDNSWTDFTREHSSICLIGRWLSQKWLPSYVWPLVLAFPWSMWVLFFVGTFLPANGFLFGGLKMPFRKSESGPGAVVYTCCLSYSGGWGWRILWAEEVKGSLGNSVRSYLFKFTQNP